MIRYATLEAAEAALGRAMTAAEAAWFRHSRSTPEYCLYFESLVILLAAYSLVPLPLAMLELCAPAKLTTPYKLQPQVRLSPAAFLRCYKDTARVLVLLTIRPLLYLPYPIVKIAGIRSGLPLPSAGEVGAQLLVYMLVEDYLGYWLHRLLHRGWAYNKIHYVHHEYPAPMGFAAAHSHWVELLILGFPAFVGTVIVPCHMTTFWLWFAIRGAVAIDTHSGFDFPFSPTKLIPFYGGAECHDYHHSGGRWSQSNFAPFFTFCDYIYGTDKGYRHYKSSLRKLYWKKNCNSARQPLVWCM
ncbi:methylsterol monooxygenase 1-1 [Sorghum bicolor]|uniref:methylsterol monooxygenase 1-1 n=1 Tax=Sorghum bicolor TaxID=4558 RepID=UPI000B4268CD|nr:methylsterol monooxygenase 1-1 [Sorghum bicolor]|eukprot:XP_002441034.2 methylsterol monooxygenase 1-1 [Sorghum bicolor]